VGTYLVRLGGSALVASCLALGIAAPSGAATYKFVGGSLSSFTNPCNTTNVVTSGILRVDVAPRGKKVEVNVLDQESGDGYALTGAATGSFSESTTTYDLSGRFSWIDGTDPHLDFHWTVSIGIHITTATNGYFSADWFGTRGVCNGYSIKDVPAPHIGHASGSSSRSA
jgi:hypothetical protein